MDLSSWLSTNQSDARGTARVGNDARMAKTRLDVPHRVEHCTSISSQAPVARSTTEPVNNARRSTPDLQPGHPG